MNIYLLLQKGGYDWEECGGFVLASKSEQDARVLANKNHLSEGPIWQDVDKVSCEKIGISDNLAVELIFLYSHKPL
jgi:hypothetical protein